MSADDFKGHESRLTTVEAVVERIEDAVTSIASSMQSLARLEERHSETRTALERAFGEITDVNKRLYDVEKDLPGLKETRGWVIKGVIGTIGIVGMAILGLVIASAQHL